MEENKKTAGQHNSSKATGTGLKRQRLARCSSKPRRVIRAGCGSAESTGALLAELGQRRGAFSMIYRATRIVSASIVAVKFKTQGLKAAMEGHDGGTARRG